MSDFREYLNEQMQDEEFKSEYEKLETEFSVIQAVIDARKSSRLTQKELSEKTGIGAVRYIEAGKWQQQSHNQYAERLAEGMGMTIELRFVPKKRIK